MAISSYCVYHCRPDVQPRDLDTLTAVQMWSSCLESLNDPFEFAALRELAAYPDKQAEFKHAGVTCFSRSLTNPLAWAHYASGHRGFAIGVDAAHPFFGCNSPPTERFLHAVRYEDNPPSLEIHSMADFVRAAVLTKPNCWAYEQEMRLIKQQGNQAFSSPKDAIKEIVFGAGMLDDRIKSIVAAVVAAGIPARFGRMKYLREGYGVRPEWTAYKTS